MLTVLHHFLTTNRTELIGRCRAKVAQRGAPKATPVELEHGISAFLDQLIKTLRIEQTSEPMQSRTVSGPSNGGGEPSEIGATAMRHGHELLQHDFTVDQVVHDYGDLCQAITDLAFELHAPIQVDEFRSLNRCLDNAIAGSVTEFARQRDLLIVDRDAATLHERLGFFAHELRNLINTATLALTAIKSGNVGVSGSTGAVLDRSLIGLRNLVDRSLADVRVRAGLPGRNRLVRVSEFITDVKASASLEAQSRNCRFTISAVDPRLVVDADRDMLLSAVGNLLQNAFKFTAPHSEVTLNAYAAADRILIDVADQCGGLPPGDTEKMFLPFTQSSTDKSGVGLGLSICRRSIEANSGSLGVRDVPGSGCVFTISLPRHRPEEESTTAV